MERFVYLFSLILLLNVPRQLECSDLETRTSSTPSTTSDVPNVNANISHLVNSGNGKTHDSFKYESGLMNTEDKSSSESSKVNTSAIEKEKNSENDTDEVDSQEVIIILKESIHNSVPEQWNRVRRDDEDGTGYTEEPPESEASDQETVINDSSQNNDGETIEDVSNEQSNEDSSSQLDPAETTSMDIEVRQERDIKSSKETLDVSEDRNMLYPYWRRDSSFDKRYWSSYERESRRNFIKIPIFPGK